jgi:hypothetical protein
MPSVEHDLLIPAPFSRVWPFVRDMDNWAPLVTGYQRHQKLNNRESVWFLKGELGGLTRVAEFKAVVEEWDENGRVSFKLVGINEPITGNGAFVAEPVSGTDSAGPPSSSRQAPAPGMMMRILNRIFLNLYRAILGNRQQALGDPSRTPSTATREGTRIFFTLSLNATGMAGAVMNMLIAPMLKPVAEDLTAGISSEIIQRRKAA